MILLTAIVPVGWSRPEQLSTNRFELSDGLYRDSLLVLSVDDGNHNSPSIQT